MSFNKDVIERLEEVISKHIQPILEERMYFCDFETAVRYIKEELEDLIELLGEEGEYINE